MIATRRCTEPLPEERVRVYVARLARAPEFDTRDHAARAARGRVWQRQFLRRQRQRRAKDTNQ